LDKPYNFVFLSAFSTFWHERRMNKLYIIQIMIFPTTILYSKYHTWIEISDTVAKVGITDFAQQQLEDIVHVDITSIGKSLKQNEIFGKIETARKDSELFLPVCGEIIGINPKIISNPELINRSPYFDGWIVRIKMHNPIENNSLLFCWKYKKLIGINE
jgi:glycine cleavage system H protein